MIQPTLLTCDGPFVIPFQWDKILQNMREPEHHVDVTHFKLDYV